MADNKNKAIKDPDALAEVEFCLSRYLDGKIKRIIQDVRSDLTGKQIQERADYETSWRGILGRALDSMNPGFVDMNTQFVKASGEWNSKTTDDFLTLCHDKVREDRDIRHDIRLLTVEWRNAVVREIGQQRYDEASRSIGVDLAWAYIDYRLQKTMTDVLIDEHTPKSTTDYILKKAAGDSLLGMARSLNQSGTDAAIEKEAMARYKANGWEWVGAKATSFAVDTATTMGFGSWSNLAKLAGLEVVTTGVDALGGIVGRIKGRPLTIEQSISKGVFGTKGDCNVFDDIRTRSVELDAKRSPGVSRINGGLKHPVNTFSVGGRMTRGFNAAGSFLNSIVHGAENARQELAKNEKGKAKQNKSSGTDEADLAARSKKPDESEAYKRTNNSGESVQTDDSLTVKQQQEANQAGWSEPLGQLGLGGMGDIGHNLGYVIAMLPDILIGTLTGKTQSLHLRDNMIPMASIVAGMFVKNPILKTVLIGLGGMNLLNKAGHESLARRDSRTEPDEVQRQTEALRFRQYPNEELNPRITNPALSGNCLVADIDRTPCTISLPDNVVAAFQAGALPLNTLANAVLAKHDAGSRMVQSNYTAAMQDNNLQNNRQIR